MRRQSPREIYFSFFMFTADLQPHDQEYTQVLVRHMRELARMGYAGFDLHITNRRASDFDYKREVDDYRRLKRAFDDEGLDGMKFATNVGTTRDYDPTSPRRQTREKALAYLKSRVDITRVIGGEGAIMSGPFLYPYGAFPRASMLAHSRRRPTLRPLWSDELQDWIQGRLRNADSVFERLADYAADCRVKLALEPVKNWETPPPNMVSEVLEFVERLHSATCGITIDTAQVLMESQGPEIFKKNVDRAVERGLLNYVHISSPDRGAVHDSWIPWDMMLGHLEEQFQGPYLIEIFNAIPPFDSLMRMSRRRFWRPGEDPNGPEELNAYQIADRAREELLAELDRVRSACGRGDEPRMGEAPHRFETAPLPATGPDNVIPGMESSPTDSSRDVSEDHHVTHVSAHDDAESFPFIVCAERYGGLDNAVRIHTFIASYTENNIANATHIIESAHALVIVDGQFLAPYARQFNAYAKALNKTIERIYLSHRHPDHWFGMPTAFPDQTVLALPETIQWIKENGNESLRKHKEKLGEKLAPKTHQFKMKPVEPHEETINGVKYVFEEERDAEAEAQLTIQLPDFGVAIVQDLIYSGTHLYLTRAMEHWRKILQKLALSDYQTFLAGHGRPAKKKELHENIEYLMAAQEALAGGMTKNELQTYLIKRYPERLCRGIFPIYLPRLYGEEPEA